MEIDVVDSRPEGFEALETRVHCGNPEGPHSVDALVCEWSFHVLGAPDFSNEESDAYSILQTGGLLDETCALSHQLPEMRRLPLDSYLGCQCWILGSSFCNEFELGIPVMILSVRG